MLALAVSAPGFFDQPNAEEVHALAQAMLLLPLWYVVVGAVARRGWTWFVVVGVTGLFVLLRMQERVEPVLVLLAISLTGVLWGSVRGRLAHPSFLLQIAGLVVFAALAVAGLASAPDLGRYLVAAGWFAHGLWDIAHYRADAGVARTGAEWCAVVDIVIAAQLVLLPLLI
ncbi:hypothetical protein GCM10023321_79760 [Pseudonocardia eucalypti]|uniref:Uncharacterized protein n=1 Tax=Pseudonocardia eucalypti TaxID=648755 RepID=A0ABP9RDX8_9PSEU